MHDWCQLNEPIAAELEKQMQADENGLSDLFRLRRGSVRECRL